MVLHHAFDVQFFNGDYAVAVDYFTGGLVNEVMPPIANPLMDTGNNLFGLPSFSGAANLLCQFALCFGKGFFFFAEETWIVNELAIGESREGFQANVNADLFFGRRQQFGADLAREAGIPLVADTANGAGLDCAVNRAVLTNRYITDFAQAQFALVKAKAALGIGERVVAVALDAGKAWSLAILNPAEKGVKSKVNANGDILQNLAVDTRQFRVFLFPFGERGLLLYFGRRLAQHFVVVLAPVQEAVVDLSTGFQCPYQSRFLRLRRIDAENIGQSIFADFLRCAFGFQYTV